MARPNFDLPLILITLFSLASVTFVGKAYETSLRGIDSNIHAAAAMSVTSQGLRPNIPIPMKNYGAAHSKAVSALDPDKYFNDHPFFLLWVNGGLMRAFGPSSWSSRFLTAMFSVGTVLVTFFLGSHLYSRAFGVLAAVFLIFTRDFVLTSGTMSLDSALVFFTLLSFLLWQKRRWVGLGLAAGFGLWMKTPLVLLVFPTALVVEGIQKTLRKTFPKLLIAGLIAVAIGTVFWILTGVLGGWEMVKDYWGRQLWGSAIGGRDGGGDLGLGFFFYNVRTGFLPGLPFLIFALVRVIRDRKWREPAFLVPAAAVLTLATILTLIRFKLGHYYTPIFPFLAMIASYSIISWIEKHEQGFYRSITGFALALLTFLLITPTHLAPEAFVALKRFVPFVQTHGSCDDRILLVPGGEPVGSALDYRLYLNFYTGRTVLEADCSIAGNAIREQNPEWVILSHEHYQKCLGAAEKARYPRKLLMGAQVLLSSRLPATEMVDLTPLELELKAVRDCKPAPYPRDLWHRYTDLSAK